MQPRRSWQLWTSIIAVMLLVSLGARELGWLTALVPTSEQNGDGERRGDRSDPVDDAAPPHLEGAGEARPNRSAVAPDRALPAPADLEAANRGRDLFGRITHSDGRGAGGAVVRVTTNPADRANTLLIDTDAHRVEAASVVTAKDGSYSIPLEPGPRYDVWIRGQRGGPNKAAELRFASRRAGERLDVVLPALVALRVIVKDADEQPVEGVSLALASRGEGHRPGFRVQGATNADGVHVFTGVPRGGSAWLEGNHGAAGGWFNTEVVLSGDDPIEVEWTLSPGRVVRGRVTDILTRGPVANARVGMGWTFFKETRTDADGHYALGGWTGNGYHEIHVLASGYARDQAAVGEHAVIDFVLDRGAQVRGRLVDSDGQPVSSAQVAAIGSGRDESAHQQISIVRTKSDADGRFHLLDLRGGLPTVLSIMAPGFGRTVYEIDPPERADEPLDLGTIALVHGRIVAGRVLAADGRPVTRAEVTLKGANPDFARFLPGLLRPRETNYGREEMRRTDDLGRFRFADLAPGRYQLFAHVPGRRPATRSITVDTEEDVTGVELRFQRAHSFLIRVRDDQDKPVPHIWFTVDERSGENIISDDDGMAVAEVPHGTTHVHLEVMDWHDRPYLGLETRRVDVTSGKIDIELRTASTLRGRLLGPSGSPLPRALLRTAPPDGDPAWTWTDESGDFVMSMPPGPAVDVRFDGVVLRAGDGAWPGRIREAWRATARGTPGQSETLTLRAEAHDERADLVVRVLDPTGKPVARASVTIDPRPLTGTPSRATDKGGSARFNALPPGRWTLTVTPPDENPAQWLGARQFDARAGPDEIEIRLRAPRWIEGTAVDDSGSALAGASVQESRRWDSDLVSKTDEHGAFRYRIAEDRTDPLILEAFAETADGLLLVGRHAVDLTDPGPVRITLRPDRGW